MPLDLYRSETLDRLSSLPPVENPEAGAFDGFVRGSATYTMRGFATTARAIDMLGAVGPIAQDAFTGGTEAQDRYFREHDEVFGSAVDYWTPRPNEVGVAGQVVGGLASLIPKVILSPGLAVGSEQLSAGEELVAKGVPPAKALTVGAIQGTATGLGLWVPILGRNLWERLLVGGAGYNVTQGVATRGASQLILADTEAAKDFRAFDPEAMTLDALLGMAFGSLAHVSPEARAQGAAAWDRIRTWAERLNPSDLDAIAALRQAEHLNVDSAPGKPVGPEDVIAHVERMKTAIDQLAKDRPVEVTDHPAPDVERATPEETAALEQRFRELQAEAERVRQEERLPHPDDLERAITEAATLETPYEIAHGRVPFEITPEMARRERLQEIAFERDLATPEQAPVLDAEVARIREELRTPSEGAPEPKTLEAQIERATPQLGPEERQAYQDLTQAFYEATAKRAGLTPEQLYERYPLEVTGGRVAVVGALEHTDRSTFLHESGHFYLDVLNELAGEGHPDIAADRDTLLTWFGVKDGVTWDQMNLEARRPYHEQFARGFETYLGEGVAPTPGLKAVFERFKEWLLAIYESLTKLNAPISDEVRGVMARMLGGEHPTEPPPAETGPGPARITQEPLATPETPAPGEAPIAQAPPAGGPAAPPPAAAGEFPAPARPKARTTGQIVEVSAEQAFALRELGREAGWLEMGGRLDMSRLADPEKLGTPAFTKWVPKAEWWTDFVRTPGAKLNEVELRRAIDKATQGEPLRKQEQRAMDYLLPLAEERLHQYGPGAVERLMEREAIQAEPKDPLAAAADRFVLQHPDLELTVGQNADGTPIRQRAAEVLTQAREARARAEEDAQLVRSAAQCLLGD